LFDGCPLQVEVLLEGWVFIANAPVEAVDFYLVPERNEFGDLYPEVAVVQAVEFIVGFCNCGLGG